MATAPPELLRSRTMMTARSSANGTGRAIQDQTITDVAKQEYYGEEALAAAHAKPTLMFSYASPEQLRQAKKEALQLRVQKRLEEQMAKHAPVDPYEGLETASVWDDTMGADTGYEPAAAAAVPPTGVEQYQALVVPPELGRMGEEKLSTAKLVQNGKLDSYQKSRPPARATAGMGVDVAFGLMTEEQLVAEAADLLASRRKGGKGAAARRSTSPSSPSASASKPGAAAGSRASPGGGEPKQGKQGAGGGKGGSGAGDGDKAQQGEPVAKQKKAVYVFKKEGPPPEDPSLKALRRSILVPYVPVAVAPSVVPPNGLSSTAKVISVVRSSVGPEVVRPLGGPPPSTLASRTLQQGSYNANGRRTSYQGGQDLSPGGGRGGGVDQGHQQHPRGGGGGGGGSGPPVDVPLVRVDEEDLFAQYKAESSARFLATAARHAAMSAAALGGPLDTQALQKSLTLNLKGVGGGKGGAGAQHASGDANRGQKSPRQQQQGGGAMVSPRPNPKVAQAAVAAASQAAVSALLMAMQPDEGAEEQEQSLQRLLDSATSAAAAKGGSGSCNSSGSGQGAAAGGSASQTAIDGGKAATQQGEQQQQAARTPGKEDSQSSMGSYHGTGAAGAAGVRARGPSISGTSVSGAAAGGISITTQPSGVLSHRASQAQGLGGPSFSSASSVSEPSQSLLVPSLSIQQQPGATPSGSGPVPRRASEAVGSMAGIPSVGGVLLPPRASSVSGALGQQQQQAVTTRPSEQGVPSLQPQVAAAAQTSTQTPAAMLPATDFVLLPGSQPTSVDCDTNSIVLQPPDAAVTQSSTSIQAPNGHHAGYVATPQQGAGTLTSAFAAPHQQQQQSKSPRDTWQQQSQQRQQTWVHQQANGAGTGVAVAQRPASASVYSQSHKPAVHSSNTTRPVSASLSPPIQAWLYDTSSNTNGSGSNSYGRPFSGGSSSSRPQPQVQYPWQVEGGPRHRTHRRPVSASPVMQQQQQQQPWGPTSPNGTWQSGTGVYLYTASGHKGASSTSAKQHQHSSDFQQRTFQPPEPEARAALLRPSSASVIPTRKTTSRDRNGTLAWQSAYSSPNSPNAASAPGASTGTTGPGSAAVNVPPWNPSTTGSPLAPVVDGGTVGGAGNTGRISLISTTGTAFSGPASTQLPPRPASAPRRTTATVEEKQQAAYEAAVTAALGTLKPTDPAQALQYKVLQYTAWSHGASEPLELLQQRSPRAPMGTTLGGGDSITLNAAAAEKVLALKPAPKPSPQGQSLITLPPPGITPLTLRRPLSAAAAGYSFQPPTDFGTSAAGGRTFGTAPSRPASASPAVHGGSPGGTTARTSPRSMVGGVLSGMSDGTLSGVPTGGTTSPVMGRSRPQSAAALSPTGVPSKRTRPPSAGTWAGGVPHKAAVVSATLLEGDIVLPSGEVQPGLSGGWASSAQPLDDVPGVSVTTIMGLPVTATTPV